MLIKIIENMVLATVIIGLISVISRPIIYEIEKEKGGDHQEIN